MAISYLLGSVPDGHSISADDFVSAVTDMHIHTHTGIKSYNYRNIHKNMTLKIMAAKIVSYSCCEHAM